jgi:hypothetical protein
LGQIPNLERSNLGLSGGRSARTSQFRHFLNLAQPVQCSPHRRMGRRTKQREMTMTAFSNYAQHAFAAIGALAISALLFANTLATQAAEVQSLAGILA